MAKDTSCPQFRSCGERGQIVEVGGFVSGVHRTEAAVVSVGKSPGMVLAMVLSSLRHSQGNHE